MKGKKWLSLALAGMLAVSALAGCGSSSSSTGSADTASTSTGSADYDLYIFNNKGENADTSYRNELQEQAGDLLLHERRNSG